MSTHAQRVARDATQNCRRCGIQSARICRNTIGWVERRSGCPPCGDSENWRKNLGPRFWALGFRDRLKVLVASPAILSAPLQPLLQIRGLPTIAVALGGFARRARRAPALHMEVNREQDRPAGKGISEHDADQSPRRLVHGSSITSRRRLAIANSADQGANHWVCRTYAQSFIL